MMSRCRPSASGVGSILVLQFLKNDTKHQAVENWAYETYFPYSESLFVLKYSLQAINQLQPYLKESWEI